MKARILHKVESLDLEQKFVRIASKITPRYSLFSQGDDSVITAEDDSKIKSVSRIYPHYKV